MENNNLHFKTNVQLKSIIGKDLINDDNIAILELVKNSFDADSKTVFVKYFNLKENDDNICKTYTDKTSRLIIQDNGLGMNIDDIQNKWLNIAYSEKKNNKMQHNRRMAGAKGVGRFSCDRLGEYLNLITKKSGDDKFVRLSINWKLFEVEDNKKEIQSVPISYELLNKEALLELGYRPFEQGVLLEIIKLRSLWVYPKKDEKGNISKWNVDKLVGLKKYLEKLINPSHAFESNDFGIFLEANEFIRENLEKDDHDKFIGKVENRVFDKLDFRTTSIETHAEDGGQFMFTELKDKGDTVFWLKERNPFFPFIKNVKISLYYLNPYAKAFFAKQTGIQLVNYGSIFLFINGFRIPPYGEVGNDWLGIDSRKTQGYGRNLGLREIVGHIEILDDNNDFQIISSREGIVKNDNYFKLTESENHNSFFFKAFRRLERYVVEGLNWDSSIYDPKDPQFKEIEQKIISGKTTEDELEYREDEKTKKSRIYSAIHSIISAKPVDVIELYINEGLIIQKIEEERAKSEAEFEQLIKDFESKKIDSDTLSRILQRKAEQNKELEKQIKEFAKYSTNEATSKAIIELQNYKKTIEEQTILIQNLQAQLTELAKEKEKAESAAINFKKRFEKAEADLKTEKQKSLYLLATRRSFENGTLSKDADGLIHTIKSNSTEIRNGIDNILEDLADKNFDINNIIKRLANIKKQAERSLKLAEIATRSNYDIDIEKRDIDIVGYIIEYVGMYGETFSDSMQYEFVIGDARLMKNVSILNLSIVIDNLITNSEKWGADKMLFSFRNNTPNELSIIVSDNGNGLVDRFLDNPDLIFSLGVKESAPFGFGGSGIGLYYSRDLLHEMNGEINFIGNNINLKGAAFEILIKSI